MALHKLLKKRARKTSVVQADSKVRFHTITSSISLVTSYQYHELRNKLANQKSRYMSLRLCGIRTRYCLLVRRRTIHKVQCFCGAGNLLSAAGGAKKVTAHDIPLDENTRIVL